MDKTKAFIIDIETYPNTFLFAVTRSDGIYKNVFEVSFRENQIDRILKCLDYIADNDFYMVSFNGIGFDYPILHEILKKRNRLPKSGEQLAMFVYELAQKQIDSFKGEGFPNTIRSQDTLVNQIDLYKIWHFNNKARATSLKMLEINMRMESVEDLPFAVGTYLTSEQIDELKAYNVHDIMATVEFFNKSQSQIDFRLVMSERYGKDWLNCDDTKIGAEYFMMRLEEAGVSLYTVDSKGKRHMRQTKRPIIKLKDCLFDYYDFKRPEFIAIHEWFAKQRITETKGVFSNLDESLLGDVAQYAELDIKRKKFKSKPTESDIRAFKSDHPLGWIEEEELKATVTIKHEDGTKTKVHKISYWGCWKEASCLNVVIDGLRIDFGVGGVHASLSNKIARENKVYRLKDADCSSLYPNLSISNRVYPEHLGEIFCDIYKDMYEQRKSFDKSKPENGMLKLALNGTYGKSNDKYSVFYDPKFTMTITVNGQLSLILLTEKLLEIPGLKLIQLNTDGITVAFRRDTEEQYNQVCKDWEKQVKLQLEYADYSAMYIRDVNNYIAQYTNGKVKRKGAYQYEDLGWHQNQGGLVIPMAAEAAMLKDQDIEEFVRQHKNKWDFMLRTKVPRSSKLIMRFEDGKEVAQQNICRYYPSKQGGKLIKIMPPLPGKEEGGNRELGIDTAWNVKTCNNACNFDFDDVDYDYYVAEAKKLLVGIENPEPIIERNEDDED